MSESSPGAAPGPGRSGRRPFIHNLLLPELAAWCRERGLPVYRARQIWRWLYVRRVTSWEEMTDLPAGLRGDFARSWDIEPVSGGLEGRAGSTRKLLADLRDGERIEAVWIPAGRRRTVCVSSQVGCRFGCVFCASGQAGYLRNLETAEIVGQVLLAAREAGDAPTHIVFMGIGEPFDNMEAVLKAARIFNDPEGLNIGARRITFSTCGVIPGIRRLAEEREQFELSVSLHAPDDALRSRLMPVNRRYPLADLMAVCRDYVRKTRRIITFEYTLIAGVNDGPEQARALASLLSRFPCRCNLIPLSPVPEFGYAAPPEARARHFVRVLAAAGVNATLRMSRGLSLKAACGQLRRAAAGGRLQEGGRHGATAG